MIETIFFSFVLISLAIAGLAMGVLFKRPALRGSCGGIACVKSAKCAGCKNSKEHVK